MADSFESAARAWHAMKARKLTPRYAGQVLDRLEANVFKQLGPLPVAAITPPDVLAVLRVIEASGHNDWPDRVDATWWRSAVDFLLALPR